MSCPTCDKTMQLAAEDKNGVTVHWCPCCGTTRFTTPKGHVNDEVPDLIKRCRKFEDILYGRDTCSPAIPQDWERMGIAEAINLPENRP